MHHANQTSFSLGHTRSPESIERQRNTLKRLYSTGALIHPLKGYKFSRASLNARARTKRLRCIGHRWIQKQKNDLQYWMILTKDGRKYEHRVIIQNRLGRPLLRSEVVHHKNGNGLDNSPDNLELTNVSRHARLHIALPKHQWTRKWNCCIKCSNSSRRHGGFGLCSACYQHELKLGNINKYKNT